MRSNKHVSGILVASLLVITSLSSCSSPQKEEKSSEPQRPVSIASKAFQATYSCPQNFAYHKERLCSDGKGRLRIEISGEGATPTVINVLDTNSDEFIGWAEGSNKFVRRPSQITDPLVMHLNMSKLPTSNAESLGTRNVNGRVCNGWKSSTTEAWFDSDFGCLVVAQIGTIKTTLVDFSADTPSPDLFEPPPGYEQVGPKFRRSDDSDSRAIQDVMRRTR